ncbi:MAG TPA: ABC transporter substrate-binding protein [Pararobbsia sp.]|nr:ABC transporter substrate-binding protein [Pararobbsia sp.]
MSLHTLSGARIMAVLLAAATLATFAGCDDAASQRPRAAAHPSSAAAAASAAYPATSYYEQTAGKPGGTLRVSVAADTGSLDFHAISDTNSQWLGRLIYDNLVYLDNTGQITPWLAKSWTISPDGKTYTFHLRDDVTFSDGTKFNAHAVLVNLEHMRDPATKSPLAAAYIAPYVSGKVIDDDTFEATLSQPYAPFLNVLAQSWLSMESPKAIHDHPKELGEKPVGSGPFVVESYTRQQGIRLVRRKDYHWAPDFLHHIGPAYLERINVDFVPEAMVRYTSLAADQYDLTIDAPAQDAATIRANPELVFESRIRQGNPFRGLTFNTSRPPFDDVRVRKGVALGINRDGIARIVGFGEYAPKADFLSINTRYYDPAWRATLNYDPAAANHLLDEAGWTTRDAAGYRTKNGQRLSAEVLIYQSVSTSSAGPVAIQSDAKKIGVELKLVSLPLAQLLERRNANDYQAVSGGVWHTNTPDGLYILYDSHEIVSPRRVGQNLSRLSNAKLDDTLERARRSSDPAELQTLYSSAQQQLTELVPAVPLYDNYSMIAYRREVKDVIFDTSHNTPFFTSVWLDKGAS